MPVCQGTESQELKDAAHNDPQLAILINALVWPDFLIDRYDRYLGVSGIKVVGYQTRSHCSNFRNAPICTCEETYDQWLTFLGIPESEWELMHAKTLVLGENCESC